jgi:hypothetical protein
VLEIVGKPASGLNPESGAVLDNNSVSKLGRQVRGFARLAGLSVSGHLSPQVDEWVCGLPTSPLKPKGLGCNSVAEEMRHRCQSSTPRCRI